MEENEAPIENTELRRYQIFYKSQKKWFPPFRDQLLHSMEVTRYDSVTGMTAGMTGGSQVYIVYENGKAYPHYLEIN